MKIFQKILIGLFSLLPSFVAVPQGSRGETREIQKRNFQSQEIFQIDKPCDLIFLPSSSCVSTFNSVQGNYSHDLGASFAFSPSPDRAVYGAAFKIGDYPNSFGFGFLVYSPLFDGVNQFVNQFQIYPTGFRPSWNGHVKLDNYVYIFNDTDSSIQSTMTLTFRFTLSTPYSTIDRNNGWYYLLPFLVKDSVSPDILSAVGYGLYQGFLAGYNFGEPEKEYQYQAGFNDGEASGLKKGYSQGYEVGKAVADQQVFKKGYDQGYSEGSNTLTPATTIWGLFGAIASVPTEILNGMGGIAIWNTPVLAILFSLLFLARVLWIIRKFI